jgi:tetratricopeptide (TPR) repeat protein
MSRPTPKPPPAKNPPAGGPPTQDKKSAAPPPPKPPLFRNIDWLTFAVTTILVFIGYFWTLAPDLGLEDSGELAVGSFYAGVPHPPGYPVWTLYTWLFTVLVPFSNIAWRVSLSSAVAGAAACGFLALMVSRGSSMMIEGINELKGIDRRLENTICMIAGFVAGMLLGFNGFMWSQAVIVEVYTLSVLSLVGMMCCLLRWVYALDQRRYLYWASFLFGICFTNHQTLIVAAMGIEVLIAAAQPKLGRDAFFFNGVCYLIGLILKSKGILTTFDGNAPLFLIYNLVGVGSIIACGVLAVKTEGLLSEWKPAVLCALMWIAGASFYFYMPLASMSNPPMNWAYPRTVDGFIHALTRGQYERTNPTDILNDPSRFFMQLYAYVEGAIEEFNLVYLLIALIPFLFFTRMQKRERAWMIGLTGIYLCLAIILLILLNPNPDRQSRELTRVFFTASHVVIAMGVGYGLTLIAAVLATQYDRYRTYALGGAAVATAIAIYGRAALESQFPLAKFTSWFGIVLAAVSVLLIWLSTKRPPFPYLLVAFALTPTYSILSHWSDNEQRGHLFGYWFGHDMFNPTAIKGPDGQPLYPEMTRDAILFGGTDPGRFNPTYMIFCESFIPPRCKPNDPNFDRRDVYIITQNALADPPYLNYIRAHYNRSTQVDPPFFQELFSRLHLRLLSRMSKPLDDFFTNLGAKIEARRRREGVYPPKEIHTPSAEDSQRAFQEYMQDALARKQIGQLRPGEFVETNDNRVQVAGQTAVMQINGLLTKVIFDKNPTNEFFVEESFPLDWMYPHLTPFGIIMKINRQPLPELTEEILQRDHQYWSSYSDRLIGNWITYDTPVSNICQFAEQVYLRRDYSNFKGDRKFIRDDVAQKSFSKLRSAIGGLYAWRVNAAKTPAEQQRMLKEADFAYKQAFAYCPYSLEVVYRYVQLLAGVGRMEDALSIAKTCQQLDPYNPQLVNLVQQLEGAKNQRFSSDQARSQLTQLQQQYQSNPANASVAFNLFSAYLQLQQTNLAVQILDQLAVHPQSDVNTLLNVAQQYAVLYQAPKLETTLQRLVKMIPNNPEAWYDLGAIQAMLGKPSESIQSLTQALRLSADRRAKQPNAKDLSTNLAHDARLNGIRQLPDFQKLLKAESDRG